MENFLNAVHNAKACFEKQNLNTLMHDDSKNLQHLCFDERKHLIAQLMGDNLLTSHLIKERINVLHERAESLTAQRRLYLDSFTKI
jgi:hypothetical protein